MKKIIIDGGYLSVRTKSIPFFRGLTYEGKKIGLGFGMMKTIKKLCDEGFDKFLIAWDIGKSEHRLGILPSYKDHREVPSGRKIAVDEWGFALMLLGYFGVKQYYHENHEADDVIASLLTDKTEYIYTTDKDMYQLVDDSTFIYHPKKKKIDKKGVVEEYGVEPKDIVELLALTGDKVDNIEGINGIGIKTASKYINGKNVSDRVGRRIEENEDLIKRNKKLIKLHRDVNPQKLETLEKDWYRLSELINKYEMDSLNGITKKRKRVKNLEEFV